METIATLERSTISAIEDIIAANLDSIQLCDVAIDRISSPLMGDLFKELSEERRNQALELQTFLKFNDAPAEPEGTTGGVAHNMWTDLRAALNQGDPYVVFLEASRGEGRLESAYRDALKAVPASALNDVLLRHLTAVRRRREQLERLEKLAKVSSKDALL